MPSDRNRRAVRERLMADATEDDISAYLNMPVKRNPAPPTVPHLPTLQIRISTEHAIILS